MRKIEEVKLFWATGIKNGQGNQYGYYTHNTELKKAAINHIDIVEKDFTDALFILSPEFFKDKIPGVNNWVFTMFEGTTIPKIYFEQLSKADYLLAPSTWVKALFDKYFPTEKSFVVPHGVSNIFSYKKRVIKSKSYKPFRFLWVGAPNPRKGFEELIVVWDKLFKGNPNFELYVKTTVLEKNERKGNVILDSRKISNQELVKLYHSAHCFVFPTRGEGFGLTLAEAMRTGCPCIATNYSGLTDFFDENVGYVVDYKMGKGKVKFIGSDYEEETEIAFPDLKSLADKMMHVVLNYNEAVKKGAKAHLRILPFNWNNSAKKLAEILCKTPASSSF
jgi:glycosyltransferase involved in cell wall biosynthesis